MSPEYAQPIERGDLLILGPGAFESRVGYAQGTDVIDSFAFIDGDEIGAAGEKIFDHPAMDRPFARSLAVDLPPPDLSHQSPH